MANTIKLKRASGSDPGNSDLSTGELAIRTSNCKLFSKNDSGSAIGIVAGSADTLTTARTIAGVSFDGSANISLNNNAITNGAGYITTVADTTIAPSTIDMEDDEKIKLGTGDDLQIFHQSSDNVSRIHSSDRALKINTSNSHSITLQTNDENAIVCNPNGAIDLYHNNDKKFETTSIGTRTTGVLQVTDATDADTGNRISVGTSQDIRIYHIGGNDSYIRNYTGDFYLQGNNSGTIVNNIKFENSTGATELYYNGSKKFETTSSGSTLTGTLTATGLTLSGSVGAAITAASDGSTITLDLGANTHQSVTLGGNRTFAAPSNQTVGQSGSIFITQDGTGSRTASFNSAFKFVGGTAPTLSTSANAVDRIDYVIKSSNVIHCAISLDVK